MMPSVRQAHYGARLDGSNNFTSMPLLGPLGTRTDRRLARERAYDRAFPGRRSAMQCIVVRRSAREHRSRVRRARCSRAARSDDPEPEPPSVAGPSGLATTPRIEETDVARVSLRAA